MLFANGGANQKVYMRREGKNFTDALNLPPLPVRSDDSCLEKLLKNALELPLPQEGPSKRGRGTGVASRPTATRQINEWGDLVAPLSRGNTSSGFQ